MAKRTIGWPRRGCDLTIATEGPHEQMVITSARTYEQAITHSYYTSAAR